MLARLMNIPATINHVGVTGEDEYGDETTGVTGTEVTVCFIQPAQGPEDDADATYGVVDAKAAFPAHVTIGLADRVTAAGFDWEVIGVPIPAFNARTGGTSHTEVTLRRTEG